MSSASLAGSSSAAKWPPLGICVGSSKVPAAFALFPKDISQPPRECAQRFFNVQRWTQMPRGGHFAALEEPAKLAEDIREWFRQSRQDPATPDDALGTP
jgi:pimeloyl-ACP methyl ester carboxylesterase